MPVNVQIVTELPTEQTAAHKSRLFTEYLIDSAYEIDEHKFVAPVAQKQEGNVRPQCEIIQVAAPSGVLIRKWTAERVGDWPILPAKDTGNPNEVFLKGKVTGAAPHLLPDSQDYCYRVTGTYWYALKTPIGPGDPMLFGVTPKDLLPLAKSIMPPDVWKAGIIGPGGKNANIVGPDG